MRVVLSTTEEEEEGKKKKKKKNVELDVKSHDSLILNMVGRFSFSFSKSLERNNNKQKNTFKKNGTASK